jgi:hypothetical protein
MIQVDDSVAKIWLEHQRIGHPSFLILQRMFPILFLHNNVSKLLVLLAIFWYTKTLLEQGHFISK